MNIATNEKLCVYVVPVAHFSVLSVTREEDTPNMATIHELLPRLYALGDKGAVANARFCAGYYEGGLLQSGLDPVLHSEKRQYLFGKPEDVWKVYADEHPQDDFFCIPMERFDAIQKNYRAHGG